VPIENVIGRAFAGGVANNHWRGLPALTTFQQTAGAAGEMPAGPAGETGLRCRMGIPGAISGRFGHTGAFPTLLVRPPA
jgi:hypothetical protein